MASNLGPGVSRVLDPNAREFVEVILQQGKPPMDAEFNLLQELATQINRKSVLRDMPSGWLGNETNSMADYITNPTWSNWFRFGTQRTGEKQAVMWAAVNGWLIPVTGTRTGNPPGTPNDTDTWNVIALDPPPANAGDFRTDFVFLEVWQARVAPNPSTTNKPSSSTLWRYGNVEGGTSFLADDLIDPALGFETSQRVQLQYRIRVVKGILGLSTYADGFDPSVVKAKGAYDPSNPNTTTSYTFTNMRQELNDAGLWRAGDGTPNNLGTVDGYVYAIPLCGVFRRNSVIWTGEPSPNLNGAFNRNPTAIDRTGVKTFSTIPTLASALSSTATSLTLVSAANLPLPSTPATPVYIQIGNEVMTYTSITGTTLNGLARGVAVAGTVAEYHAVGSTIKVISTRPDELYADQVVLTDILDLRHLVNPNGFDYQTLLRYNFDKLLKGELRANWKRSGGNTQGTFVAYQDKVSTSAAALGVTQVDGPDNIRMVFSDAITVQPVELVVAPNTNAAPADVSAPWGLALEAFRVTAPRASVEWGPGDVISVPVDQLKDGLPAADGDQVRWCNEGNWQIELRIDGYDQPLDPSTYAVTPSTLTSADDLLITLTGDFPTTTNQLYIKLYALYGAGRGLSRRPDAVHSLDLLSPSNLILHTSAEFPANNYRMQTAHAVLWSKFYPLPAPTSDMPLPVMAESYIDQGSKTVVLQPFRSIDWPDEFRTIDGTGVNLRPASFYSSTGDTSGLTIQDLATNFATVGTVVGDAIILGGIAPGRYVVQSISTTTNTNDTLTLDRPVPTGTNVPYTLYHAQGLMPLYKRDGTTPKWTTTDPLGLFSGTTDPYASTKNLYVSFPTHLAPSVGAVHCPILPQDAVEFNEGVNFMFNSLKGAPPPGFSDSNYIPYSNGTLSYAVFTTLDLNPPGTNPAPYNGSVVFGGNKYAGIRKFTDPRGLNRQGLQLPPFYGIARLWGVYEANDYKLNGSPYDATTREKTSLPGKATNLLNQNCVGPTFWIETDEDGDATFILSAEAIDIKRSPNAITSFATGNFIIEASIFGFDRDAFNLDPLDKRECRIVLCRATASTSMRQQANSATRANNLNAAIAGPVTVLPGPLPPSDTALVNYSRTPYGGDAWGTQTNNIDISYNPGPIPSGIAYQLASTSLDQNALTRPNQKPFEILATLLFSTTAGTGRVGGMADPEMPFGDAGYEDIGGGVYPPSSPLADRPNFNSGGLSGEPLGSWYLSKYTGCTERLPLGALRRDKDFRAVSYKPTPGHFHLETGGTLGAFAGFIPAAQAPLNEPKSLVEIADGTTAPGTVVVQVDGEQANYALLNNFRTFRGGSGFVANGSNAGGYFGPGFTGVVTQRNDFTNVLSGAAYLVRNYPTNKGPTEISAGSELMMVVVTQFQPTFGPPPPPDKPMMVQLSTAGLGEGDAALDYYRIEGHPLVNDHVRVNIDPSTIPLARNILPKNP